MTRNPCLLAVFAVLAVGCGPAYMTASTQPAWNVKGPLAPVVASEGTGSTASLGLGLGNGALSFEATLHALDLGGSNFEMPSAEKPILSEDERLATIHSSLEARWRVIRWRRIGLIVRGGGTHGVVLDKMTLDHHWGIGYKAGAGVELRVHKHVVVWADASHTAFRYVDGPTAGSSTLRGITVGIALGR